MRHPNASAIVIALPCAAAASGAQSDPKTLKDQLTGDAEGSAAPNPQCKLFTQAEGAGCVGAPVAQGQNNGGGAGCRWSHKEFEAWATVGLVAPNYFLEPDPVKGVKRLPALGKRARVAPDSGWSAGGTGACILDSGPTLTLANGAAREVHIQIQTRRRRPCDGGRFVSL